jgi:hypothetical protein
LGCPFYGSNRKKGEKAKKEKFRIDVSLFDVTCDTYTYIALHPHYQCYCEPVYKNTGDKKQHKLFFIPRFCSL